MLRNVFIVMLIFVSEVAFGQPQRFIQQQQADQLLQRIVQREYVAMHVWGLSQLTAQDTELHKYVRTRAGTFQPRTSAVDCYLNAITAVGHSAVMKAAWDCERLPDLGVLYLYSLEPTERAAAYRSNLTHFRYSSSDPVIDAYLKRALNPDADVAGIAGKRAFRAADVLLIPPGYGYSDGNAVHYLSLLDHWSIGLQPTRRSLSFADTYQVFLLIDSYHVRSQYERVYPFMETISGSSIFPDIDIKLRTYRRLAFAAYYLAYYQSALDFYRRDLLPTVRRMSDGNPNYVEARLRVETDFGSILFLLGDIQSARDIYAKIFHRRAELTDLRARSTLLNNLAVAYLNTGMVGDYLSLQFQALSDARLSRDNQNQLQILNNLYVFHWRRGDWENGIRYLNKAYEVALESNAKEELGNILSLYGTYHREFLKNPAKALEFNDRAISLLQSTGSKITLRLVQFEKALTLESLGRYDDAIALYTEIESDAALRNDLVSATVTRIQRIHLLQTLGRHGQTSELVTSLKNKDLRNTLDFEKFIEAVNVVATDDIHQNQPRKALALLEPVVTEIFTRIENSADSQTGFIRFKPEFAVSIRILVDLHLSLNQLEKAAELLDAVKTVNQSSLNNSNLIRSSLFSESERLEDFKLMQDIEQTRGKLMDASETQKLELNNRLLQLQRKRLPGINFKDRSIHEAQQFLGKGHAIVSITVVDHKVYRTTVTRTSIRVNALAGSKGMLEEWSQIGTKLQSGTTPLNDLHKLYQRLLGDVMKSKPSHLIFIPDGPLHRIPVEILPTTAPASETSFGSVRFLIEDLPVTYSTSIREHHSTDRTRPDYTSDFLGVGISRLRSFPLMNPLPFAEQEVNRISNTLSKLGNQRILTGAEATEAAIRQNAAGSRILHIASHSEVNMSDPLFSVIYLEANETDDGALYAYELFGMNLDMELIMLSSCESGSGSFIQGSGMVGLGRALRSAGARSLVMNMWSIQDQTAADISTWFYEHLNQGFAKDEALRAAKIRYLTTRSSNPHVWGSFILIGENDPLINKISIRDLFVGGILMLILGGALLLVFYRRS